MTLHIKMSDRDGRPVFLDADTLDGIECGRPAAEFAAEWALSEARAILAESEPKPIELYRHVAIGATAYPYEDEAQGALAEALANFLAE